MFNLSKRLPLDLLIKYLLEGLAVVIATHYLSSRKASMKELFILGATAAFTFFILDTFAPSVGAGARMGAGWGIGSSQVGFERFCDGKKHPQA